MIAETFNRPSSGSNAIQGHTNAVVWIEPIRIVNGKEGKGHYSSGNKIINSMLVISPWVQERQWQIQRETEGKFWQSTQSQRAIEIQDG